MDPGDEPRSKDLCPSDVQYLDYKVLVQILLDTEPELFEKLH